jgi:3-keto-disaccharide hydrolase
MRWKFLTFIVLAGLYASTAFAQNDQWLPNDTRRPLPKVVSAPVRLGGPPSDAIVLFDGKNLNAWEGQDGGAPQWRIENGDLVVAPGTGNIHTRQAFGDCQLHLEWTEPIPPRGSDQGRGNSGVMLMSSYEIQVLDMWQNKTYADGGTGAVYGQYPPLVNVSRKPGEWQSYDIVFHRPRFDASGHLTAPARFTVFQNCVLVQDDTEPTGPTAFHDRPPYMPGPEKLPLMLQDHGAPVRYRNIWIRELPASLPNLHYTAAVPITVDPKDMVVYAGRYQFSPTNSMDFQVDGKVLLARRQFTGAGRGLRGRGAAGRGTAPPAARRFSAPPPVELVPINHDVFVGEWSGNSMRVTFIRGANHEVTGVVMQQADTYEYAPKAQ